MRRHVKVIGIVAALALVAALVGAWAVFAQSPTATPPAQKGAGKIGGMMRGGMGRMDKVGLEAAAKVLGMTADQLSTQLWGGKTLADLATQAGVDLQKVQDAVNAAHKEATRAAIEQAVKDGKLTREKADWLLTGLDKGYWGGQGGFGFGGRLGGFGGFGGRGANPGRFGGMRSAPKAPTASS